MSNSDFANMQNNSLLFNTGFRVQEKIGLIAQPDRRVGNGENIRWKRIFDFRFKIYLQLLSKEMNLFRIFATTKQKITAKRLHKVNLMAFSAYTIPTIFYLKSAMKKFLLYLFYPLSSIYGWVTAVRNFFYNVGWCKSKHHSVLVISVGNLTFGGSGKTPHVAYLVELLSPLFKVAVLSRGYGRSTKGFREVGSQNTVSEVGDEPLMYALRYAGVPVAVDENRNHGIEVLKKKYRDLDVVILDDAFQHRSTHADLSLLISDYARPFYNDKVFPFGMLREYKRGCKRADIIIFSKVPDNITPLEKRAVLDSVDERVYQEIYFSSIVYADLRSVNNPAQTLPVEQIREAVVVTGIANPKHLWNYLEKHNIVCHKMAFGDHYCFTSQDIDNIVAQYKKTNTSMKAIITTEKDAMRLRGNEKLKEIPLFYIPIEINIHLEKHQRGKDFDKKIIKYVRENKTNSKFNKSYRLL